MNTLRASVALPTYNAARIVGDCLASLHAQDFPAEQMEIVVGDNGSTDGTLELIASRFPAVRVVPAAERGSGYARNAAFRAAHAPIVCSIDADCVAEPGWVSALVAAFDRLPDSVGCVGGQISPYRVQTVVEHYQPAWIRQQTLRDGGQPRYAETPNAAFRRAALDTVGLFDGTQGFDDTDLGMRLTAAGFGIEYVPEAIVRHRNPATLRELYRHRLKYGAFQVRLARKHPQAFGIMDDAGLRSLARVTLRRVLGDIGYKLPRALLTGDGGQGTRLWPVLDAVVAVGNYTGAARAVRERVELPAAAPVEATR